MTILEKKPAAETDDPVIKLIICSRRPLRCDVRLTGIPFIRPLCYNIPGTDDMYSNDGFYIDDGYEAVVVGAGHAGCEAALALARKGHKTLLLTLNLESVAFLACNPSIGGTAKGHLVREIDAIGGQQALTADKTLLSLRMLNRGSGAAVHSLRGQVDKNAYHTLMKKTLENTGNLYLKQGEAVSVLTDGGRAAGVRTALNVEYRAKTVVVASGVYLNAKILIGDWQEERGPSGFMSAKKLSGSLKALGFGLRRFKTGTPARIDKRSIDFDKFEVQRGETDIYPFSFMTETFNADSVPCYLGYTNSKTHEIILKNIKRSAMYSGNIVGTGARYCPSIEDKIVRFADKDRHQLFLEPEGADTNEIYVQGVSTSLPPDVQRDLLRSIDGLENAEIMRDAYAIEYDCIDSRALTPALMSKTISGLFFAGQINGTSGYEEAAAQGLIAGINAALLLENKPPYILTRNEAYIGVLIDDLVTKGTNEPYRMMTGRAEYRLSLRQDNADFRLTEKAAGCGLVTKERLDRFRQKNGDFQKAKEELRKVYPPAALEDLFRECGEALPKAGLTLEAVIKRGNITAQAASRFLGCFKGLQSDAMQALETELKYEGYLKRQQQAIDRAAKMERAVIPGDFDYGKIKGLRIEARQKLAAARPLSVGQASRISGVNPADIAVLLLYL